MLSYLQLPELVLLLTWGNGGLQQLVLVAAAPVETQTGSFASRRALQHGDADSKEQVWLPMMV